MKYKSRFLFCCLSVVLTGLWSATVHSQAIGDRNRGSATGGGSGSHSVSGKVFFPDGRPAGGVTVTINGFGFGSNRTVTDKNGGFLFIDLPKGSYNVDAKVDGYETAVDSLTIDKYASRNQGYVMRLLLRSPGQRKGEKSSPNPLLKDVPKEPLGKYEQAMEKLEKSDPKAGLVLLDEALALYPNFAAAAYEKGAVLLKQNELDKALEAFVKAVSIKPDYLEAKYSFGYTHYMKKNFEIASAVFEDVLKQKADMPEARLYLGISLYEMKNVDRAESQLKLAVASRDNLPLAHLFLGSIYAQKKRNADAVMHLRKYLDLMPKAPNAEKIRTTIADLKKQS